MPELPEVESLRRSLIPFLLGRTLGACTVLRQDVCQAIDEVGAPSDASPAQLLQGQVVTDLIRRGKNLAILSKRKVLSVHLGMSGALEVRSRDNLPAHTHVTWSLGPGKALVFSDPRRFGGLTAYASQDALQRHLWARLGPDALECRGEDLRVPCGLSARAVKAALLDQGVLAGVGNIYADESLFLARVNPLTPCRALESDVWERLATSIRCVLATAIQEGGSTIRSYRNGAGEEGRAQTMHGVYGRGGQPCLNCGLILSQGVVCQRTTVWCDKCQGQK